MTIFDLLFIVVFLASVVTLLYAAIAAVRGRRAQSLATLRHYAICFVVYMAIVLAVAVASPQRVFQIGDKRCFDDWCIAVIAADRSADSMTVTLRLSNEARRVGQRELGLQVYVTDAQGRRFASSPDPSAIPLDVRLEPGQSVETKRHFPVAQDAKDLGLIVIHEGSFCFPGCLIIGDDSNPLHKPTIVRLP
jgi:hypothetical protein